MGKDKKRSKEKKKKVKADKKSKKARRHKDDSTDDADSDAAVSPPRPLVTVQPLQLSSPKELETTEGMSTLPRRETSVPGRNLTQACNLYSICSGRPGVASALGRETAAGGS
jgi:hypothetical protein